MLSPPRVLLAACLAALPAGAGVPLAQEPAMPPSATPAPTPAPAPAPRHTPVDDVRCLHEQLGLADLTLHAPASDRAWVVLDPTKGDRAGVERGSLPARAVRMHREADGRFTARLRSAKPPALSYTFAAQRTGEAMVMTEDFVVELQPPTPTVPAWAMGATWYQIFPERFRNANPLNDPKGSDVFLAKWTDDWYRVQAGELEAWNLRRGKPEREPAPRRTGGELYHVIWDRRYGGDLQGIEEKLDELKDLGVTALYLNPIFESRSLHKYDASDFRHVDDWLGRPRSAGPARAADGAYSPPAGESLDPKTWTWTPADEYFVKTFLPACKKRGLRVVLDGVWNHAGRQFWAFQDVVKHGNKSPYAPWFIAEFDADGAMRSWSGWDGKNGWLPEFRQVLPGTDTATTRGDINAPAKQHIFDVTARWMDPDGDGNPADGIDGWRVDVAGEIGPEFWRDWRAHVKKLNPDAVIIAEIWSKVDGLGGQSGFDTQMNYPFAYALIDWLTNSQSSREGGGGGAYAASALGRDLARVFADAPQSDLIKQNLVDSHDTDRFVSMLFNPGRRYDRGCTVQNGDAEQRPSDPDFRPYNPGKPDEASFRLALLGHAIQTTYAGSPMIYYGTELGMWGADDPTCRKPTPWPDKGRNLSPDDAPNLRHREALRGWLRLRQDRDAGEILRLGTTRHLDAGSDDVFAFERCLAGERVVVIANRGAAVFENRALLGRSVRVPGVSAKAWLVKADGAVRELR